MHHIVTSPWLSASVSFGCVDYGDKARTCRHCHHYAEEYQNHKVMHNHYVEEYQNNTVSQISGKISCMCKRLKPDFLSAVTAPLTVNALVRG